MKAFLLALVLVGAAHAHASPVKDLVSKACADSGLHVSADAKQEATAALEASGWDSVRSIAKALPFIDWKEDFPNFHRGIKIALLRFFDEQKQDTESETTVATQKSRPHEETGEGEVAQILQGLGLPELVPVFQEHGITSKATLLLLDGASMMQYMGISDLNARLTLLGYIRRANHRAGLEEHHRAADAGARGEEAGLSKQAMGALVADLVKSHKYKELELEKDGEEARRKYTAELISEVVNEHFNGVVDEVDAAIQERLGDAKDGEGGQVAHRALSGSGDGAKLWIEDDAGKIALGPDADIALWRGGTGDMRTAGDMVVEGSVSTAAAGVPPRVALDVRGDGVVGTSLAVGKYPATSALDVDGTASVTGDVSIKGTLNVPNVMMDGKVVVDGVDIEDLQTRQAAVEHDLDALDALAIKTTTEGKQWLGVVNATSLDVSSTLMLGEWDPRSRMGLCSAQVDTFGANPELKMPCHEDKDCQWGDHAADTCTTNADGEEPNAIKAECLNWGDEGTLRYSTATSEVQVCQCTSETDSECQGDTDGTYHKFWGVSPGGSGGGRDKKKPIMRWQTWSTYDQCCNWIDENSPLLFGGGLHPSSWGDGNGCAHSISDTERLYQFFSREMECGWSCNVNANSWYCYSSTNSKHTGVWMRLYNENDSATTIRYRMRWTAYDGWGEQRSWAVWCSTDPYKKTLGDNSRTKNQNWGSPHYQHQTLEYNHPAKQTCNVIIIAASTQESGHLRANALLFKDNSLKMPDGITYLNDFEKVGFGHHTANPY